MSTGTKVLNNTVLEDFLGSDGITELKSKMIDMIVEEVRGQLAMSSEYIISPDDIADDLYKDVIEEIKKEIIEEYKSKIAEAVNKRMESVVI